MQEPGRLRNVLFILAGLTAVLATLATWLGSDALGWASLAPLAAAVWVYVRWRATVRQSRG